jgi:hypothetical protein
MLEQLGRSSRACTPLLGCAAHLLSWVTAAGTVLMLFAPKLSRFKLVAPSTAVGKAEMPALQATSTSS